MGTSGLGPLELSVHICKLGVPMLQLFYITLKVIQEHCIKLYTIRKHKCIW